MEVLGLVNTPTWIILLVFIAIGLYWLGSLNHDYWKKQGVPYRKPTLFLGFSPSDFKRSLYTADAEGREMFGKVYGYYIGSRPELMVHDHDLITEIAIKQFQNFTDRRPSVIRDEMWRSNLLDLKGDHWKDIRSQLSPTFTTGKLRMMSAEINRSAKSFAKRIISTSKPFDAKVCAELYTLDCIASTAFGLRTDSQTDENNEFAVNAKKLINSVEIGPKMFFIFLAPKLLIDFVELLGFRMSLFDQKSLMYFNSVFNQTIKDRSSHQGNRADFIQLMLNAKRGENIEDKDEQENEQSQKNANKRGVTDEEIIGNALLFFFAGFDTVSIGLSMLMYNLACNQEAQDILLEEVDRLVGDGDDLKYEAIAKMQYLEQCINESLRLFPPAFRVDRMATNDTKLGGIEIKKGMIVNIPIQAVHYDPDIWPEPKKFKPERFSPENKASIKPSHWMAFGIGPRNCIGMRQALYEIKVAIVQLLKTHRLVTCDKTEIPLKLSTKKIQKAENGAWIAAEARN